jgi:hypothetical protein
MLRTRGPLSRPPHAHLHLSSEPISSFGGPLDLWRRGSKCPPHPAEHRLYSALVTSEEDDESKGGRGVHLILVHHGERSQHEGGTSSHSGGCFHSQRDLLLKKTKKRKKTMFLISATVRSLSCCGDSIVAWAINSRNNSARGTCRSRGSRWEI